MVFVVGFEYFYNLSQFLNVCTLDKKNTGQLIQLFQLTIKTFRYTL